MSLISVVVPVYRAEDCVGELCRRLKLALEQITQDFEIILVDDRSSDSSWQKIRDEASSDSRIRGLRLSRNFGQHRAITAGLDRADAEWVVVMDCDLQDPPEEISRLYAKACEGYQIVVAEFEERREHRIRQYISQTFWRLLSKLAGTNFDFRNGNFRIMSRLVVENFRQYREQLRLLGGITNMMGFTTCTMSVARDSRYAGASSYTLKKLLGAAVDICMAYSDTPLKISVGAGLFIAVTAVVAGVALLVLALSGGVEVPGWASVVVSIYLMTGLLMASVGVVGYYVGRIFDEVKRRPLYVVEEETNRNLPMAEHSLAATVAGRVVWITGLSASGKTTLAKEVVSRLKRAGSRVVFLDGDELREVFGAAEATADNHGRDARLALAMKYAHLCRILASQGTTVVIATISLFREVHAWNRANLPNYLEVFLKVPIEELRRRDPKGIYRRFDAGEISNVAGLDLQVDEPQEADLVLDFAKQSPDEFAKKVIGSLAL
jgi:adenylylsulfate kinase-like enzyme/glycosyltransferase involved in cell wall biosynthesis